MRRNWEIWPMGERDFDDMRGVFKVIIEVSYVAQNNQREIKD